MYKIYVGCSLTHAPKKFVRDIETLKETLRKRHQVLDFIGLNASSPRNVFEWDTQCVREAHVIVAVLTHPSLGLGVELGMAIESGKPILAVAEEDVDISKLVLGVTNDNFAFARYESLEDVPALVDEFLSYN